MKINLQLFFLFFAGAILLNYTTVNAQTDEEDPKLKMLEDRITRGEEKVEIAERKLFVADSLIKTGEQQLADAEEEFAGIESEQQLLEKDYRSDYKVLSKQARSKNPEVAKKAEEDRTISGPSPKI